MGNIASSNPSSASVTNKRYTTQDVARNIETLLRASTVKDMSIASDTMKFRRSDNPNFSAKNVDTLENLSDLNLSSIGDFRGGSKEIVFRNVPSRDRYSQFDKQSGGSQQNVRQYSATSNDYTSISDADLTMLKDMILRNQDGGCPCNDDGLSATSQLIDHTTSKFQSGGYAKSDDGFSATSSQPIDYSILKGGGKDDKKKKDKKKKESEDDEDEDDEDKDDDLSLDDDDDEDDDDEEFDEDDGDELSRVKESSSTSDTDDSNSSTESSTSSSKSDLSRINMKYGDYAVTTESDKKFVVNAKQFYSSESGDVYGNDSAYLKNNRTKNRMR
jgi:hypothetical protein